MTKREELDLFVKRLDELSESKYIVADIKIINLLTAIASSETILALFKNVVTDFDYIKAKNEYLVKSVFSEDKGEFILPTNTKEMLAFVFSILVEIDSKDIIINDFINKYFFVDGSFSSAYDSFLSGMIRPFANTLKNIVNSLIEGKLQDPIEALIELEEKRKKEWEKQDELAKKEKELSKQKGYENIKALKELLLENKGKVKASKLKEEEKEQVIMVIDYFANSICENNRENIVFALVSYRYMAKAHPVLFRGKLKKVKKLIKGIINEL